MAKKLKPIAPIRHEPADLNGWKFHPPKREPLKVEDLTRNWPKQ